MVPSCASGEGCALPSFIGATQASCNWYALSRVICVSGL
jgi:hypothetical protein